MRKFTVLSAMTLSCVIATSAATHALSIKKTSFAFKGLNLFYEHANTPVVGHFGQTAQKRFMGKGLKGALGLNITPNLSLRAAMQGETPHHSDALSLQTDDTMTFHHDLFLLNVKYTPFQDSKWRPYILAGAGWETPNKRNFKAQNDPAGRSLVWQLGSGIDYNLNHRLKFGGSYRFLDAQSLNADQTDSDYAGHEIKFGLTWQFDVD